MEVVVEVRRKIRKRTKETEAYRSYHEDNSSSCLVGDGPTSLTSFGQIDEPPSAPEKYIGDALINQDTEAPKSYFPRVEFACCHLPPVAYFPPAQPLFG